MKKLLKKIVITVVIMLALAMAVVLYAAYASVKADEWWATAPESEIPG